MAHIWRMLSFDELTLIMDSLPYDVLEYLGKFLAIKTRKNLVMTCKYFQVVYKPTIFRDGFLTKRLTCEEMSNLPLINLRSSFLKREEKLSNLPLTLQRFIIDDVYHAMHVTPKIILNCRHITFYTTLFRFRQSVYNIAFFEKLPNLRLYTGGRGWLCLAGLENFKNFRFHRLVLSHIEACYSDEHSCDDHMIKLLSEMKFDELVLNTPIRNEYTENGKWKVEMLQKLIHLKITFLSTNMFALGTIFPLDIFGELRYLQNLHFGLSSDIDLDKLVQLPYLYIEVDGEKHFCKVQNLPLIMFGGRFLLELRRSNIYRVNCEFHMILRKGELWRRGIYR